MDAGLIGLGNMGAGIARSLLRAGHHVTVYNRTSARADALRSDGAAVATTVAEACRAGIVLTMVADDAALESTVYGDGGILSALPRGGVHVSLSTISTALSERLAAAHAKAGQDFLAAPVFGRPEAAEAGRHVGIAYALAGLLRALPVLTASGRRVIPADIAARAGLDLDDGRRGRGSSALPAAVAEIAAAAEDHLQAAQKRRGAVTRAALPALLPAVVAQQSLKRLRHAGYDPFDPALARVDPLQSWRLTMAALRGRF